MLQEKAGWRNEVLVDRGNYNKIYEFLVPAYCLYLIQAGTFCGKV